MAVLGSHSLTKWVILKKHISKMLECTSSGGKVAPHQVPTGNLLKMWFTGLPLNSWESVNLHCWALGMGISMLNKLPQML